MSRGDTGFTERVRQEVARRPVGNDTAGRAELAALLRIGGSWTPSGAGQAPNLVIASTSGAVVRRAHRLLVEIFDVHPELTVTAPAGMRTRSTYRLCFADVDRVGQTLGIVGTNGTPLEAVPDQVLAWDPAAWLRGAVLAASSFSAPGRPPHAEFTVHRIRVAEQLADVLEGLLGTRPSIGTASRTGERIRVVLKSGRAIGDLLVVVGGAHAFLEWDDRRLRRQLRSDANRLANADTANVRRSVDAAAAQVQAVERTIQRIGWEELPDELREIALVRLANPTASLSELGELLDPHCSKATVRRRLQRLAVLGSPDQDVSPVSGE